MIFKFQFIIILKSKNMSFFRGIKGIFIDNIFDQAFEKIILN